MELDREALHGRIYELLSQESTLVLATGAATGRPSACSLFYVADPGLRLSWYSSPESRHSLNVGHRADAAIAVHAAATAPAELRGVQLEGRVELVSDEPSRASITAAFKVRHGLGDEFDRAILASSLYRFVPRWARLVDNRLGFGFKAELALDDEA